MIKAIIFDMDGLLIDSEPLWEEAEIEVFKEIGVTLTSETTKETMGLRVDEVVAHWFNKYPWEDPSQQEVQTRIVEKVIQLVKEKGTARPGVHELVKFFKEKHLPLAIASSSQTEIINAVLEKLKIDDLFDAVCSAEHETYGKPHPGVYISASKMLGVETEFCLAFEDSPNGVLSAKSAKMKCVAVPDEKMMGDKRFAIADLEIKSLVNFGKEEFNKILT